jgi:nitroreductase
MTQATELGLATHPISGYDHAAAKTALSLPEGYESVAAITLGKLGSPDTLSEGAREREVAPRTRLDLDELVLNGKP